MSSLPSIYLICILLINPTGCRELLLELMLENLTNLTPLKLIRQFTYHDLVIHCDNKTSPDINFLFDPVRDEPVLVRPMRVVNYDIEKLRQRPAGLQYLNIVFLSNPLELVSFVTVDYNLKPHDVVLFITYSLGYDEVASGKVRMWEQQGIDRASGLFIFDLATSEIFTCCYYCGSATGVLKRIGKGGGKVPSLMKYMNDFYDFNGHLFRIAYANFPPFFNCRYLNGECQPEGPEGQLLKTFSQRFNFKYKLILYNRTRTRGQWENMVQEVHFRQIDWAIGGLSVSIERGDLADWTRFIKVEGYTVLFSVKEDPWASIQTIIMVFQWPVFLCLGISVFIVGFVGKFSVRVTSSRCGDSVASYIQAAVRALLEQPTPLLTEQINWKSSTRTLFLIWWLLSLCVTTYYRSQLASLLIKPKISEPNTVDDLVDLGYKFQVNNQDWSVLKENFMETPEKVYKEILKRVDNTLDFCDAVLYALHNNIGVIDEETAVQYEVFKHCSHQMSSKEKSTLRLVTKNLFEGAYQSWCMQLSNPFRYRFSKTIGRLDDCGLTDHWYQTASASTLPRSNDKNIAKNYGSLTMFNMLPPFVVLAIGVVAGSVVFACEYCYYDKVVVSGRRFMVQ